jgi:hypothetical protein
VDATVEAPDVLTNEVLAVRLTSGPHTLAVVLDVGDAPAEVVLPFPGGTVAAGSGSVHPDGGRTTLHIPAHSFTVVGTSG